MYSTGLLKLPMVSSCGFLACDFHNCRDLAFSFSLFPIRRHVILFPNDLVVHEVMGLR